MIFTIREKIIKQKFSVSIQEFVFLKNKNLRNAWNLKLKLYFLAFVYFKIFTNHFYEHLKKLRNHSKCEKQKC